MASQSTSEQINGKAELQQSAAIKTVSDHEENKNESSRPAKKKMKSNDSVDREYDYDDDLCKSMQQDDPQVGETEIFVDCNESSLMIEMKKLAQMVISMKSEMTNEMQQMRLEVRGKFTDMNDRLDSVVQNVKEEVKSELEEMNKKFDKKVDKMLDRLENNEKAVEDLRVEVGKQTTVTQHMGSDLSAFNTILEAMGEKIIDQDARSKRNNMIIHGIPESEPDPRKCENLVLGFFRDQCGLSGQINVQRAHRLGGDPRRGPRPVIVLFLDYKDKERSNQPGGPFPRACI